MTCQTRVYNHRPPPLRQHQNGISFRRSASVTPEQRDEFHRNRQSGPPNSLIHIPALATPSSIPRRFLCSTSVGWKQRGPFCSRDEMATRGVAIMLKACQVGTKGVISLSLYLLFLFCCLSCVRVLDFVPCGYHSAGGSVRGLQELPHFHPLGSATPFD